MNVRAVLRRVLRGGLLGRRMTLLDDQLARLRKFNHRLLDGDRELRELVPPQELRGPANVIDDEGTPLDRLEQIRFF